MVGGPQQLYHLDAYIPLRINSDESKAAFHRKRRVPRVMGGRGGGAGKWGHWGTCTPGSEGGGHWEPDLWTLIEEGKGAQIPGSEGG